MSKDVDGPIMRLLADSEDAQSVRQIREKTGIAHRDTYLSIKGLLETKMIERVKRGGSSTTYRLTREGRAKVSRETEKQ